MPSQNYLDFNDREDFENATRGLIGKPDQWRPGPDDPVGTSTPIAATREIKTGEEAVIDGVRMVFWMTPGTEAPAEMNTCFPQFRAMWMAENTTNTLHNILTLRGAQVRDASKWASFLNETIELRCNADLDQGHAGQGPAQRIDLRLNGAKAAGKKLTLNVNFTDLGQQ